jgi:hypothetical protein
MKDNHDSSISTQCEWPFSYGDIILKLIGLIQWINPLRLIWLYVVRSLRLDIHTCWEVLMTRMFRRSGSEGGRVESKTYSLIIDVCTLIV